MPSKTRTADRPASSAPGQLASSGLGQLAPPDPGHLAPSGQGTPLVQDRPAEPTDDAETAGTGLRVIKLPGGWPPYDCETHGIACPATAAEVDRQPVRPAVAAETIPAWDGVPVYAKTELTGRAAAAGGDRAAESDQAPGPSAAWCGQFAQVLIEVLAGCRPVKQLARVTTELVREQINLLSCTVADGQRPRIRRVMMSRPAAGVVEMTMVASFGSRSRAVAMRFEHVPARPPSPGRPARPARWLCTEIETS